MIRKFTATLIPALVVATIAWAADGPSAHVGDPEIGRTTAMRWCASCHDLGNKPVVSDRTPNLAVIARGKPASFFRSFLAAPHPPMPELHLSRGEIDDLTAYLVELGKANGSAAQP